MGSRILRTAEDVDEFVPAISHEGRLLVARDGRVMSADRLVPSRYGSTRTMKGRPLKPMLTKNGYLYVQVGKPGGGKKNLFVHRLVAETFIPNPLSKPYVNHLDNNPTNNAVSNLEWCTQAENVRHAQIQGRIVSHSGPAQKSPAAKLCWAAVRDIRTRLSCGETQASLAVEFGVSKGTIGFIARNETWVE